MRSRQLLARVPKSANPHLATLALDLAVILLFGGISVHRGQDLNFDQQLYHFWSADQLLHGTTDANRPAIYFGQYLNPLVYAPWALVVKTLPPRMAGFVFGCGYGIAVVLVRRITFHLLPGHSLPRRTGLSIVAAAFSAGSAIAWSELGTSFADWQTSIPILLSILLLIRTDVSWRSACVAGLLTGAALGLKLTNAPYAVALVCATAVAAYSSFAARARITAAATIGLALGFTVTGGYWTSYLVRRFGSPTFPLYNGIFRSKYYPPRNFEDIRFKPHGLLDAMQYPFYEARGTTRISELQTQDPRWVLLLGTGALATAIWAARTRSARSTVVAGRVPGPSPSMSLPAGGRFGTTAVSTYFVVAWFLWVTASGIGRYLVPLELASGVLLVVIIVSLTQGQFAATAALLLLSLGLSMGFHRVPQWGHREWADSWYGVTPPSPAEVPADATVIHWYAAKPATFLLGSLPPHRRTVVVSDDFFETGTEFLGELQTEVASSPDTLLVYSVGDRSARPLLGRIGMRIVRSTCEPISNRIKPVVMCRLAPRPPAG